MPTDQFKDVVLPREYEQIRRRREKVLGPEDGSADPAVIRPVGLAFSGGGIRSATFNLGVLQGLADLKRLKYVDYLSTVSGGGYIGAWLHSVIRNHCRNDQTELTTVLSPEERPTPGEPDADPITFLRKYSNYLAPRPGLYSTDTWVMVSIWLRNVLLNQLILVPSLAAVIVVPLLFVLMQQIPKDQFEPGLQGAINIVLVLLAFGMLALATIIAAMNLDRVVERTSGTKKGSGGSKWVAPLMFGAALVLGCGNPGQRNLIANLQYLFQRIADPHVYGSWWHQTVATVTFLWLRVPIVLLVVGLWSLFAVLQLKGGFGRGYVRVHGGRQKGDAPEKAEDDTKSEQFWTKVHAAWMVPVSSAVSIGLILAIWHYVPERSPWFQMTFAPPLVCGAFLAGVVVLIGLMGVEYPDEAREWLASIGATLSRYAVGWMGLFVIAVYAPRGFAWLLGHYGATALTAAGAWVATTAAGVFAGRSAATGADASKGKGALGWLIAIAPPAFLIGYLLLISFGVHQAFAWYEGVSVQPNDPVAATEQLLIDVGPPQQAPSLQVDVRRPTGWLDTRLQPARDWADQFTNVYRWRDGDRPWHLFVMFGVCIAVALVASKRININEFSMHHFYKNRLVRCYLGAGNGGSRRPDPVTGFDPKDDFPLSTLAPEHGYTGPYPIVNTTLNINTGIELAQQERKSASFAFTPDHCGFLPSQADANVDVIKAGDTFLPSNGYQQTMGYSAPLGPTLGTVTAISGAAANPNSGYSTSGPMAFLLTVFDARLGWWLGNPRWEEASRKQGPSFALWYLLAELLGQTTARSRFVNLSDGGHFENLGLYELVRRRCQYIIVCDSEEDGGLTFGSLGGAIRKCRADFGVEIDINPDPIRRDEDGFSSAHCVMGTITYPEGADDPAMTMVGFGRPATKQLRGWLFYLKSSLTGDEPTDVTEYHSRYQEFPHQSTADQFFSESQFESYRRLGLHVVRSAFEEVLPWQHEPPESPEPPTAPEPPPTRAKVFQSLTRKWYAPIVVSPEAASRLADAYSALMRTLRETEELKDLVPHLLPAHSESPALERVTLTRHVLLFGTEVIQLMENVYTEFQLEYAANRANPRNNGWMKVFQRWATPGGFLMTEVWPRVEDSYNPLFQRFVKQLQHTQEDMPRRA